MIDFFNIVRTLSDEELSNKLQELTSRYYYASAMAMSSDIKEQLGQMIEWAQEEIYNRSSLRYQEMWNDQFPDVIETDPLEPKDPKKKSKKVSGSSKKDVEQEQTPKNAPAFNKVYRNKD